MDRKDYLQQPVKHIKIDKPQTVNQLMLQFKNSGSFGAGRLATACDIFEKMVKEKDCTVFLALSGAIVPAGLRTIVADLVRRHLVDVIVTTGACMVHDAIEAVGGHHYRGSWIVDDVELYRYHLFRIYDIFVTEEDYMKLDYQLSDMYDEIAKEHKGKSLSSNEFTHEIGKRLTDKDSILRAAYEENVPIFVPALRDSEFGFIHWMHSSQEGKKEVLQVDAFKEVPTICNICEQSPKNAMIVLGGGVPRNTVQSSTLASKKGLDYAIIVTMDRPETGGLSGSTLEEAVSWGKVKGEAAQVTVVGDAMMVFPFIVASVTERVGEDFKRQGFLQSQGRLP
ncbi:MAG: deoxyhypusine synthase family protein [Candidatus Bathyarchaeota archaeon]|nr:deoxyhypusine synthase family protein [Candidatus Bathyarchaeota archaeon]